MFSRGFSPWFLHVCSESVLKTMWKKEKSLVTSNFSFSHSVFYLFRELSAIIIKFEIVFCKLFQFGRVQSLPFGKRLKVLYLKLISEPIENCPLKKNLIMTNIPLVCINKRNKNPTSLNVRKTLRPSTSVSPKSTILTKTMRRSKLFHPTLK